VFHFLPNQYINWSTNHEQHIPSSITRWSDYCVSSQEKHLDDIGKRWETCSRKSLCRLSQKIGVSKQSAEAATKLLRLTQLYICSKTPILVATIRFCNWFCESVCISEADLLPTYCTDEIIYKVTLNTQNTRQPTIRQTIQTHTHTHKEEEFNEIIRRALSAISRQKLLWLVISSPDCKHAPTVLLPSTIQWNFLEHTQR